MDLKAALLIVLAIFALRAQSLSFELKKYDTRCLSEDINSDVLVLGNYRVHSSSGVDNSHKLHVRVQSPYGHMMHMGEGVEAGQFSFKAEESGTYMACFWMDDIQEKEATMTVDLDWKMGVHAKNMADIAKTDKIQGMEAEIRKLEDMAKDIVDEMYAFRMKDSEMADFSDSTSTQIVQLGVVSLIICVFMGIAQVMYLKRFFERKKLL